MFKIKGYDGEVTVSIKAHNPYIRHRDVSKAWGFVLVCQDCDHVTMIYTEMNTLCLPVDKGFEKLITGHCLYCGALVYGPNYYRHGQQVIAHKIADTWFEKLLRFLGLHPTPGVWQWEV